MTISPKHVRLGDVLDIRDGTHDTPKYVEYGVPLITSKNLTDNGICFRNISYISESDHKEISKRSAVSKGDILYGMIGTIGRPTLVETDVQFSIKNVALFKLSNPEIDNRYFLYLLKSEEINKQISQESKGGTQKFVSLGALRGLKAAFPPLPEQRRIAAILDKADALRAKRRETIAKLDQLLQSVFLEMFGDPVTNPKGWPETDFLGDVADICSGITKGRRTTEKTRETPYLAVANVQDRHLKLGSVKTICATDAEIERYRLAVNDLLLTEGGDPDKLGRGALWDGSITECIHQNHVFRVRITSPSFNPVFLNWLVGSARGKRYFLSVSKQTTGIASINMTQLKKFPLLAPPIALQAQFALAVSKIEAHRRELEKARDSAEQLFQSFQQQAFTGAL